MKGSAILRKRLGYIVGFRVRVLGFRVLGFRV